MATVEAPLLQTAECGQRYSRLFLELTSSHCRPLALKIPKVSPC